MSKQIYMLGGESALEKNSTFSEGGDSRVRKKYSVPHNTASKGLSVMGILEPRPKQSCLFMAWSYPGISILIEGTARIKTWV